MATTISSAELDSPEAKVLILTVPENDAIRLASVLTFAGAGLTNLNAVPQEYYAVENTNAAANATATCSISISAVSTLGFTVTQCSPAGGAVNHTFRLYIHTRRFYQ